MNINNMRDYISNAYPGRSWKAKCSVMSEQQVIAIYYSIRNREKDKQKTFKKSRKDKEGYQFTIFDFLSNDN